VVDESVGLVDESDVLPASSSMGATAGEDEQATTSASADTEATADSEAKSLVFKGTSKDEWR
jgi:hypothetical protein